MRFSRAYIEISNQCNLSCPFCSPLTRAPRRMSRTEFAHIIGELEGHAEFLYFHVKGEPLLHPDLPYFLELCETRGFQVHITTNGTLLKQAGRALLESSAVRQINLSLHSLSALEPNRAARCWEEILDFCQKAEGKKYVILRLWTLGSGRKADSETLLRMQALEQAFAPPRPLLQSMSDRRSVSLAPGVFVHWEEEFTWPDLRDPPVSDTGLCQGLRKQIAVLADGTVTPCCLDAGGVIELGNLFSQPLEEILSGERAQAMEEGFRRRILCEALCRSCTYRTRFR